MTPDQIARVCHEANRGYQAAVPTPGIPVAASWDEFPEDQKTGVVKGVELALTGATPQRLHASWVEDKIKDGWIYGPIKDTESKTHPCLVGYTELPEEQIIKDHLFAAIVRALS